MVINLNLNPKSLLLQCTVSGFLVIHGPHHLSQETTTFPPSPALLSVPTSPKAQNFLASASVGGGGNLHTDTHLLESL